MRSARSWLLALAGLALPIAGAFAGSLSVGPQRLQLSAKAPVAVVMVRNTGSSPTLVQVEALDWARDGDGGDHFAPTSAVVASPAVVELQPGQQREIRVGLRNPRAVDADQSFRLYVREVNPVAVTPNSLQFALRIGIPVYIGEATSPRRIVARAGD